MEKIKETVASQGISLETGINSDNAQEQEESK